MTKNMKYSNKIFLLFLLSFILLSISNTSHADSKEAMPPARVVTEKLIKKPVAETTKVVGTIFFDTVSHLSTDVSGLVASLSFTEGDIIKKGEKMLHLNTDFINNEIDSIKVSIEQINIRLKKAEKDLRRYETLYKQNAASEKRIR